MIINLPDDMPMISARGPGCTCSGSFTSKGGTTRTCSDCKSRHAKDAERWKTPEKEGK